MLPNHAIIFSGIVHRKLRVLPAYLMLIVANALPVWGAAVGKLVFFQVIYLYWFESLLLVFFDCIRIMAAQGSHRSSMNPFSVLEKEEGSASLRRKTGLVIRTIVVRVGLLLFYLLFIVLFIGFQLTAKAHGVDVLETLVFRNRFFNTSILVFLINMTVQLIGGFFMNGKYRTEAPANYASIFGGRTILIHVMIVGSVFIHQYFFQGKSYEATGEIAYIGIFMLIKTVSDLLSLRARFAPENGSVPMI